MDNDAVRKKHRQQQEPESLEADRLFLVATTFVHFQLTCYYKLLVVLDYR